jgi:hypothetical protein
MVAWKRVAPIVAALVISLGITVVLGTGVLSGGGSDSDAPLNISQNDTRTPAPLTNATLTGDPPTQVGQFPSFENVASEVGFEYRSTYRGRGLISQSGVYAVDYNNDGYEDLLATGGTKPVLFKNTGGAFERARTFNHPNTRTAHFFDYNNDGWQDLVLAEYAGDIIFYQNNNGSFERRSVGLAKSVRSPTVITSADFTGNGCLDLFIGQNGLWQQGRPLPLQESIEVNKKHPAVRPTTTPGGSNLLFYGTCETFQSATEYAGIRGRNWTLVASAADFTGDGSVDIHVGNDYSADFLYVNTGNGTFRRHDLGPKTDRNAMASVAKDMTGDGNLDLFITNIYMTSRTEVSDNNGQVRYVSAVPDGNNFLVNTNGSSGDTDTDNLFSDMASEHGLQKGGWGWAAVVDDFNNDGHLDIIHGTSGDARLEPYHRFRAPQVWKGTHSSWEKLNGSLLGLAQHQARGMTRIDFDNDGGLDFALATTSANGLGGGRETPFALYENRLPNQESNESLQLLLRNYDGVSRNAVVLVETNRRTIQRTVNARSGFLSQDSRLIHVGTAYEEVEEVRVFWPDETTSTYDIAEGGRYILTPDGSSVVE